MTNVMLVGTDLALLEGLAQSLARLGHRPAVTTSYAVAADLAAIHPPLVLVADRSKACNAGAEMLTGTILAGGARLLYRSGSFTLAPLSQTLQRAVLGA